jgi:hypothetical protein
MPPSIGITFCGAALNELAGVATPEQVYGSQQSLGELQGWLGPLQDVVQTFP